MSTTSTSFIALAITVTLFVNQTVTKVLMTSAVMIQNHGNSIILRCYTLGVHYLDIGF